MNLYFADPVVTLVLAYSPHNVAVVAVCLSVYYVSDVSMCVCLVYDWCLYLFLLVLEL